jgi:hypothetical protein
MDHRLAAVPAKNKMANVGSSRHCLCDLVMENLFLHRWMRYCTDRGFEMADLKTEKGCATISLGLNYCSMGPSQPPSRDTVPLSSEPHCDSAAPK